MVSPVRPDGWGARIRTWEWRYQKPLPYRLATPQQEHFRLKGEPVQPPEMRPNKNLKREAYRVSAAELKALSSAGQPD